MLYIRMAGIKPVQIMQYTFPMQFIARLGRSGTGFILNDVLLNIDAIIPPMAPQQCQGVHPKAERIEYVSAAKYTAYNESPSIYSNPVSAPFNHPFDLLLRAAAAPPTTMLTIRIA